MEILGKPKLLKQVNSSTVERLIFQNGPVTKSALAEMTKLSVPTVNKIVDDLVDRQIVVAAGYASQGAGRKALLYRRNEGFGCVVALYFAESGYIARLADIAGNLLAENFFPLDTATAGSAVESTCYAVQATMRAAPSPVKAIGLGVPGVVMPDGTLFGIPKIRAWEGFNLKTALQERVSLPVHLENDVKLAAVGYYLTYLSELYDNVVYIYAGSGTGSGIIINKKLFRGASNFSGELGFMAPLTGEAPERDYTCDGGYLEKKLDTALHCAARREELINLFTAIAANYTAIINPDAIVFGGESFDVGCVEGIRSRLGCYAPDSSIPQVLHDESERIGIHGLVLACIGEISTGIQFVQDIGV